MRITLAISLFLCACGPAMQGGGGDIELTAAATAAGDSIELTLSNRSGESIGYNLCTAGLQQQTMDGTWEAVPTDRVCTMELRTLQSGSTTTYRTTLPPGTTAGDYRFLANVELMESGQRRSVTSNIVRVTG